MISVIVPVYQAEKYLSKCIESILSQTYKNIEVILVDDGSKDNSPFICDQFAEIDSRVKVIHKQNGGVSSARNSGLDIACGDYISFVDSDDYIELYMYAEMMEKALEYHCDIVMCDCVKESKTDSFIYSHNIRGGYYNYEQLMAEYYPHLLVMENVEYPATISNCTMLFKKSILEENPTLRYIEGVRFSEDLLFGAQLMIHAKSFFYMKNEGFYHYFMNDASASHQFVSDKWHDYEILWKKMTEYFNASSQYDFKKQIDLCLLFFLYNFIGDIIASNLSYTKKEEMIVHVLSNNDVREMLNRISVFKLKVSYKLKFVTLIYKYKLGISLLIKYYGFKNS